MWQTNLVGMLIKRKEWKVNSIWVYQKRFIVKSLLGNLFITILPKKKCAKKLFKAYSKYSGVKHGSQNSPVNLQVCASLLNDHR